MTNPDVLAERFETARPRLRRIAARILGSTTEADDALQESWLRISRADTASVTNLDGWLTTVVSRVCLDTLKWRESRREEFTADDPRHDIAVMAPGEHPEDEAMLADEIGVALALLLDTLSPAERVAFVLHDMFDVPFDDIATIVERTPEAARQLASRARRRVRGASADRDAATQRHDELVRAFFAASRAGNISALLALLDPGATLRADKAVMAIGAAPLLEGAQNIANTFVVQWRGSVAARPAYFADEPAALWMNKDKRLVLFRFTIAGDRIANIDLIGDPNILAQAVPEEPD